MYIQGHSLHNVHVHIITCIVAADIMHAMMLIVFFPLL